jgi:hypothetical protein
MTTRSLACAIFVGFWFVASGTADDSSSPGCRLTDAVRAEPPRDRNADPFGSGPWYVNADRTIWAGWDAVRMRAGQKGNKVLWIRPAGIQLTVTGRRLDAEAPPMKPTLPCCYPTGFQASGLAFPTAGCWEITAVAGTSQLTFVTRVAPESDHR